MVAAAIAAVLIVISTASTSTDIEVLAKHHRAEQHCDDGFEHEHRRHRRLQRAGMKRGLLQKHREDPNHDKQIQHRCGEQRAHTLMGEQVHHQLGQHGDHTEQHTHRESQ